MLLGTFRTLGVIITSYEGFPCIMPQLIAYLQKRQSVLFLVSVAILYSSVCTVSLHPVAKGQASPSPVYYHKQTRKRFFVLRVLIYFTFFHIIATQGAYSTAAEVNLFIISAHWMRP